MFNFALVHPKSKPNVFILGSVFFFVLILILGFSGSVQIDAIRSFGFQIRHNTPGKLSGMENLVV